MCSMFQPVLEVFTAHQGHRELWIVVASACSPVDRMYVTTKPGVTTLVMAENHIKTNSSGLQYQA